MIRVTFLGTGASRPTIARNVSAIMVTRMADSFLFDCGEGTQRQMMRFGTGFTVDDIFVTHVHADHFLGIIGLLRTMGLQGREEPVRLWSPKGTEGVLHEAVHLGVERVPFAIEIVPLEAGDRVSRDGYRIEAFRSRHAVRSLGYALVESERLGRFHPDRAREMGVPEGPLFGRLHRGESIEVDGRIIRPEEVVGPPRPGRKVVYTGDTRPSAETVRMAASADLLIHDATFAEEELLRARSTRHSTAREAAQVALKSGARRLALTHISSRYGEDARALEREARAIFQATVVAYDGLKLDIPLAD